jgi:predicted dehydrogenase
MKKLALVGAGGRARDMFAKPFVTELKEHVELVGIFDTNQVRARLVSEDCGGVPFFNDFQVMLDSVQPDAVVVASADHTHHTYIIAAMEAGLDVISEKPMTIDAAKSKAIIETEQRTGKSVTVTFNVRFVPYAIKVKELLMAGSVGEIYHVSLDWFLDRSHGADYFRRWHAQMEYSGGLLVHKATHHFDMLNWWLDSHPEEVHAFGSRRFYGPTREERGERCMTCNYKRTCEFYFDLTANDFNNRYYVQAEKEDGYYRDQCVFGERINIYDNMTVNVRYDSGALLNYSLVAYSPYEGYKATIHGSKGRMEVGSFHSSALPHKRSESIRIFKPDGELIEHHVPISSGAHGGSDEQIRRMIFVGDVPNPIDQQAGSLAGAMSLLIGAAANISIAEGRSVKIANLL